MTFGPRDATALRRRDATAFGALALGCTAAVAIALVSQHRYGMQPCPWCVLQRIVFLAIAVVGVVGAASVRRPARRMTAALVFGLSLCGVAAALWQHFRAAASASCALTLADKIITGLRLDAALPDVFEPRASCVDAAVRLLGVPYDFWSLGLFLICAAVAFGLVRNPSSR